MQRRKVRKAVIPVAGLGTRFLPITKSIPKEMLPIVDRPTLQLIVDEAADAGIEQIILVNGRHKNSIEDYFDNNFELNCALQSKKSDEDLQLLLDLVQRVQICSIRQREARGLGHAILCAKPWLSDEPFAVLLGDDLIFAKVPGILQLMKRFEANGQSQIAVMKVPDAEVELYGVALGDQWHDNAFDIAKLVEKPKRNTVASNYAVAGRYVFSPDIWQHLEQESEVAMGEVQLTSAMDKMLAHSRIQAVCFEGMRVDAGTKIGYLKANLMAALSRADLKNQVKAMMEDLLRAN